MKIFCQGHGCQVFLELSDGVTLATKYICRDHARKAPDTIRFQQFQFDEDQIGSGADPRVYERARQAKKTLKFPNQAGRHKKENLKKIEALLDGHESATEIIEIFKKDIEQLGPKSGPDNE